jgi:hypothetical protein
MLLQFIHQSGAPTAKSFTDAQSAITSFLNLFESNHTIHVLNLEKKNQLLKWCNGFQHTLHELEQSLQCTQYFTNQVNCSQIHDQELHHSIDYLRFVYFYKNALIRIFSLLDKLGYFMNHYYDLHTEKMKHRFSFFTVLRELSTNRQMVSLSESLQELKKTYQSPLYRLRDQRNLEIHYINIEMVEPLLDHDVRLCHRFQPELISEHVFDLYQGFEMVTYSCHAIFQHALKREQKLTGGHSK